MFFTFKTIVSNLVKIMRKLSFSFFVIIVTITVARTQYTISNYYEIKNNIDVDPNVAVNFTILTIQTDISQFCLSACNSNNNCLSAIYKSVEKKCSLYSRYFLTNELVISLDTRMLIKECNLYLTFLLVNM